MELAISLARGEPREFLCQPRQGFNFNYRLLKSTSRGEVAFKMAAEQRKLLGEYLNLMDS